MTDIHIASVFIVALERPLHIDVRSFLLDAVYLIYREKLYSHFES